MVSVTKNSFFHVVVITILALVIFIKPLVSEGLPMWADNVLPVLNMENFKNLSNFTYVDKYNGLVYNPILISFYLVVNHVFIYLSTVINNVHLLSFLWIFLPYYSLYLASYFAYNIIFKDRWVSFILTVLYVSSQLNFSWITAGWSTTTYSHAGSILYFALFIRYLKKPELKTATLIALASIAGFFNIAYFYAVNIGCLIYFIYHVIATKLNIIGICKQYKTILVLPILIILLNFFWILPTPIMARSNSQANVLNNIYSSEDLTLVNSLNFATSLQIFPKYHDVFEIFNSGFYRLIFTALLGTVLYLAITHAEKDKDLRVVIASYFTILGLSLGNQFPMLWKLFTLIPGSFLIRSPQLKFYSLLFFFFSLLIGHLLQKYKSKLLNLFLCVLIVLGFYGFYKGDIFGYWQNVKLPKDYIEVSQILNKSENRYEIVAMFPRLRHLPTLSWTTNELYSYFPLEQMTTNPFIFYLYGPSRVPTYLYDVYDANPVDIPAILGSSNVKYILQHKDFVDIKPIYEFNKMDGLLKLVDGTNVNLFEINDKYITPIFSVNGHKVSFDRINPVSYSVNTLDNQGTLLFNRQFDVNWNLYRESDLGISGYTDCKTNNRYKFFCDILLSKINPVDGHKAAENNRNSWEITETTGSGFLLYYKPQYYLYIGLAVSALGIAITMLILILSARKHYD